MINWLRNGVFALAVAGAYSIFLVMLRTPGINQLFTNPDIFRTSLVIHVNLSVLVWLLAISVSVWNISKDSFTQNFNSKIALVGVILMAISPILIDSGPVMNNYIPMLENILFVLGLCIFGASILIYAVQTFFYSLLEKPLTYGHRVIKVTRITTSLLVFGVWGCFYLSYLGLEQLKNVAILEIDYYYEMLFWSGGHLLQFIYTQMFMFVLICLVESISDGEVECYNVYEMLLILNFVLASTMFIGHFTYDFSDGLFKEFFTNHMIYTAGIVPGIFIIVLTYEIWAKKIASMNLSMLAYVFSVGLFVMGGFIGAAISGINVVIPAHYHGSIVGISVAMMGFVYLFIFKEQIIHNISSKSGVLITLYNNLEEFLGCNFGNKRYAKAQLSMIAIGQFLHILGLALAGGYGVMRKTPGEEIAFSAKIYMGITGLGGLIAIIGGLMFVHICAKNLYFKVK